MPSQRTVTFRPSIVLFVGECGEQIYRHFVRLCASLDVPLRAGIACIQVDEAGKNAQRVPVAPHDPRSQQPCPEGRLSSVFADALLDVQSNLVNEEISENGYLIENANTQVLIAAHTGRRATATVQLATVARQIQVVLAAEDISTQIHYVLSDYRTYDQTTPIKDSIPPEWARNLYGGGELPLVTFCFLYQKKGHTQRTFNSREMVEYAPAEALFTLIATSIMTVPALAEATQTSPRIADITERIGSLGTSLIRFPRAEAIEYCTQRLSADLLAHWTHGLHRRLTPDDRAKQQQQATRFEERVRRWIGGKLWAFQDDHSWPHPQRLSSATQESVRRYGNDTAKLFDPLREREVERTAAARAGDDAWNEAVKISAGRTRDYFPRWEAVARDAWEQVEGEIVARLTDHVDRLWLDDHGSWEEANEYIGHLSARLVDTKEQLIKWRKRHERRYRREFVRHLRMAPPTQDDASGSVTGVGDADITGLVRPDARGTPLGDDLPPPLPSQSSRPLGRGVLTQPPAAQGGAQQEKDPLEDDLRRARRAVERRTSYQQKRVPNVRALVGVALATDPPLSLLALDLLPSAWRTSLALACAVFLVIGFCLMAAGWLYRIWTLAKLEESQLALIACYKNLYRYRCDRHEDNLRAELVMGLHWRLQAMSDLLRDWPQKIIDQQNEFEADATATEAALFAGPSGARDVLIGNGQWLRSSLSPVYDLMRREHVANPVDGWHSTFEQINDHLRKTFRASSQSVFGEKREAFKESILTFTRALVEPYLGRSADIGTALRGTERRDIWAAALRRAEPLYSGFGGGLEETVVCGRPAELDAVAEIYLGRSGTFVPTKHVERNKEWLLVAKFRQGGVRTNWPPRYIPGDPVSGPSFDIGDTTWDDDSNDTPPPPFGEHIVSSGHFGEGSSLQHVSNRETPPGTIVDEYEAKVLPGEGSPEDFLDIPPGRGADAGSDEILPSTGEFEHDDGVLPGMGLSHDDSLSAPTTGEVLPAPALFPTDNPFSWSATSYYSEFPPDTGFSIEEDSTSDDDNTDDDEPEARLF